MTDSKQIAVISNWLGQGSINFFGLPFAGKDDQAGRLTELLNGNKISGGDILRSSSTPEIRTYIDAGKLPPSDLYIRVVVPYLSQPELKGKPLMLSSVGRWDGEEIGVMHALKEAGHGLKAVLYLKVSQDDALARLRKSKVLGDRGQREDDAEEKLATRFEEFETKTLPVIDHYRQLGLLIEIDATQSREDVQTSILNALADRASS